MTLLTPVILGILAGFFTKAVDLAEDNKSGLNKYIVYLMGITYGLVLALTASNYSYIAPLVVGVVAAVVVAGKIDAGGHYFGIGSFLFFLLIFGRNPVAAVPAVIFFLAALLDEKVNDLFDSRRIRLRPKAFRMMLRYRPFLEVTAFIFAALTGLWLVWFYLLAFDITYLLTPQVMKGINNFSAGKKKKAY